MRSTSSLSISEIVLNLYKNNKKLILVLIGGLSRAGKSNLSEKIKTYILKNRVKCNIISLDNWIIDIDKRTGQECVRERFNYSQIIHTISNYLNGKDIRTPQYDPAIRKKSDSVYYIKSIDKGIIIVEGVIALDIPELRQLSNLKIYVETIEFDREARFHSFHLDVKKMTKIESEEIYRERQTDENPVIVKTRIFSDIIYKN